MVKPVRAAKLAASLLRASATIRLPSAVMVEPLMLVTPPLLPGPFDTPTVLNCTSAVRPPKAVSVWLFTAANSCCAAAPPETPAVPAATPEGREVTPPPPPRAPLTKVLVARLPRLVAFSWFADAMIFELLIACNELTPAAVTAVEPPSTVALATPVTSLIWELAMAAMRVAELPTVSSVLPPRPTVLATRLPVVVALTVLLLACTLLPVMPLPPVGCPAYTVAKPPPAAAEVVFWVSELTAAVLRCALAIPSAALLVATSATAEAADDAAIALGPIVRLAKPVAVSALVALLAVPADDTVLPVSVTALVATSAERMMTPDSRFRPLMALPLSWVLPTALCTAPLVPASAMPVAALLPVASLVMALLVADTDAPLRPTRMAGVTCSFTLTATKLFNTVDPMAPPPELLCRLAAEVPAVTTLLTNPLALAVDELAPAGAAKLVRLLDVRATLVAATLPSALALMVFLLDVIAPLTGPADDPALAVTEPKLTVPVIGVASLICRLPAATEPVRLALLAVTKLLAKLPLAAALTLLSAALMLPPGAIVSARTVTTPFCSGVIAVPCTCEVK